MATVSDKKVMRKGEKKRMSGIAGMACSPNTISLAITSAKR